MRKNKTSSSKTPSSKPPRKKLPAGSIPAVVSAATTFITAPLYPDGSGVDFALAVEERFTANIAPVENGYIDLVRAFGKAVFNLTSDPEIEQYEIFSTEDWKSYANKLGLDHKAEPPLKFRPFAFSDDEFSEAKSELFDQLRLRPWAGHEQPEAEKWLLENKQVFEVFETAIQKPHFYSTYTPGNSANEEFFHGAWFLPGIDLFRSMAFCFAFRSNYRLGNGDVEGAWSDIALMYRLARQIRNQPLLISSLVGMAIEGLADATALAFLGNAAPGLEQIRTSINSLENLPAVIPFAEIINSERLYGLYEFSYISKNGFDDDSFFLLPESGAEREIERLMRKIPLDWNVVLKLFNISIDRVLGKDLTDPATTEAGPFTEVAEIPRYTDREWFGMDIEKRSELLGKIYIHANASAWGTYARAVLRAEATLELTKIAFLLETYRRENGSYPERLEFLCECDLLESLPLDRMALEPGLPYIYRNENSGYILYSRGISGRDDGGRTEFSENEPGGEYVWHDDVCIRASIGLWNDVVKIKIV